MDITAFIPDVPWRPWEGRLPWGDPGFSERMLAEHLSQEHDLASRRSERIDAHAAWLHDLVGGRPTRVLDLGCGPGLYTERLAALGHQCVGIDVAPAAVAHARNEAARLGSACTYRETDLVGADLGTGFGLVLVLYGDIDTYPPGAAAAVLEEAAAALAPGGVLVMEVHTTAAVYRIGTAPHTRRAVARGLFADRPHVLVEESRWFGEDRIAMSRIHVVDAATGVVQTWSITTHARDYEDTAVVSGLPVEQHPLGAEPWVGDSFRVLTFRR